MADEFEDFDAIFAAAMSAQKRVTTSLCTSETTFGEGSQLFDLA